MRRNNYLLFENAIIVEMDKVYNLQCDLFLGPGVQRNLSRLGHWGGKLLRLPGSVLHQHLAEKRAYGGSKCQLPERQVDRAGQCAGCIAGLLSQTTHVHSGLTVS